MVNNSPMPPCSVSWCSVPAISRKEGAYCQAHYQQAYRNKNPEEYPVDQSWRKCEIPDCTKPVNAKGLCFYHGGLARQGKIEAPEGMKIRDLCTVPRCQNIQEARGVCHNHYCQIRYWGLSELPTEYCQVEVCKIKAGWSGLCTKHYNRASKYKMTLDELNLVELVAECENPGCNETKNLCIDHDHKTGKIRGVLCTRCNTALGMLLDDAEKIVGLEKYLSRT